MTDIQKYITVGIPFYNCEKYLALAIKSVQMQTYPYWELILIDDGSSDRSLAIAQEFAKKDSRIRIYSDGENKKLATRLNEIAIKAKYDWIARLDADDLMHPDRLRIQIEYLEEHPDIELVSSGLVSINSDNIVKGYRQTQASQGLEQISLTNVISHPSVMGRRSWFLRNPYSSEFPRAEDYELWMRAISKNDFKMVILPDLLLFYREEGNISYQKMLASYQDVTKIYQKYGGGYLGVIKMNLKEIVLFILYKTGYLQSLAQRRNKSFSNLVDREKYQEMINIIVHAAN